MKIINENGIINLDSFDKVSYRESLLGCYVIEAKKTFVSGGLFGGTQIIKEEISSFPKELYAKQLVEDITKAWVNDEKAFDVNEWIKTQYTVAVQTEGKVVECTFVENDTILSSIGLEDSIYYKTLIEIDNNVLERKDKEIYFSCKGKVGDIINVEIEKYKDKIISIKKVNA